MTFQNPILQQVRACWPPLLLLVLSVGSITALCISAPPLSLWAEFLKAGLLIASLVFGLDALCRREEFLMLIEERFLTDKHINRYKTSWCRREMLVGACWVICPGTGFDCRHQFHRLGYRWWHIFPDGSFTSDSPYLKRSFWVSVLCFWRAGRNAS